MTKDAVAKLFYGRVERVDADGLQLRQKYIDPNLALTVFAVAERAQHSGVNFCYTVRRGKDCNRQQRKVNPWRQENHPEK